MSLDSRSGTAWDLGGEITAQPYVLEWGDKGVAGWETGTRIEPPSMDERVARALERIAAALERLAPNRPNFLRGPFEATSDLPANTGSDRMWTTPYELEETAYTSWTSHLDQ